MSSVHNDIAVVGTLMKDSRQRDLLQRQLLHMACKDGTMYIPLQLDVPLEKQAAVGALLVKVTDFVALDGATGHATLATALEQVRS
jgi:hypothetical protein